MDRRKTVRLGDTLRFFWKDHPEMYHKMMEARVQRLWGELLGPSIAGYTTNVYVKNRTLYVSIASSIMRSELIAMRKRLVMTLNEHAGADVIDDVVIR
jgi:predicted nucleic acid-binding Zn ribbon protein